MTLIDFSAARARLKPPPSIQSPSALVTVIPADQRAPSPDALEDRLRMRQNLMAGIAVAALTVLGAWVIENLRVYSQLQMCLEAGHKTCKPLNEAYQPSRFDFAR